LVSYLHQYVAQPTPKAVKPDPNRHFGKTQLHGQLAVREILPVVADQQLSVLAIQAADRSPNVEEIRKIRDLLARVRYLVVFDRQIGALSQRS
jgi:hypothetical protein